jgi:hypothetical protein
MSNRTLSKCQIMQHNSKETLHNHNTNYSRLRCGYYTSPRSKNLYSTGKILFWICIISSYTNKTKIWGSFTWSKCLCPTWNIVCNSLVRAGRDAVAGTGDGAGEATSLGSRALSWPSNQCELCCTNCHITCRQSIETYSYKHWTRKDQGPSTQMLLKGIL